MTLQNPTHYLQHLAQIAKTKIPAARLTCGPLLSKSLSTPPPAPPAPPALLSPIFPKPLFSPLPRTSDITIIGAGAAGVAVTAHVLRNIRQQKLPPQSVTMIEKAVSAGPGLAYGHGCEGTIVNMAADTMGIFDGDPGHFVRWMRERGRGREKAGVVEGKGGRFPERTVYGRYLEEMVEATKTDAEKSGMPFEVVNGEVKDVEADSDEFQLLLGDGRSLLSRKVVLALGNFSAVINRHLIGNPNFMESPWPAQKLKEIPTRASVVVIGSRLTAIDAVLALADNGHEGPITMVSRSGLLPKVQGDVPPYERQYVLYSAAREAEDLSTGAFAHVIQALQLEINQAYPTTFNNWWHKLGVDDPVSTEIPSEQMDTKVWCRLRLEVVGKHPSFLETLRADIQEAENGDVGWQAVLKATAPLAERYWHSFTAHERLHIENFMSLWMCYRHSMPLVNAKRLLALMASGQLEGKRGIGAAFQQEGHFEISTHDGPILSQYLIEAIGQEHHPQRVDSLLVRGLLAKQILKPQPFGGVSVDFTTLETPTKSMYVLGSMTRGVHLYTNAIDRNAAHAARIADHLTGIPPRRSLHVAFFVGSDLFSHLMLAKIVPQLIARGHMPFVYLPQHRAKRQSESFLSRELAFFERTLLHQHVIPFLGSLTPDETPCLTVRQMQKKYGILVQDVKDVNDSKFLGSLKDHHIDFGLSLRCYQRFQKNIIAYFQSPRVLLNLHPGVLPEYRGVMTANRAMTSAEERFGYSLHHVNEDYDSGDVVDIRTRPIDYQKSMLLSMEDMYPLGVDMAVDAIEHHARGRSFSMTPQDPTKSHYYSFPTELELNQARMSDIRLVDPASMQDLLVRSYASPSQEKGLRGVIQDATEEWYSSEKPIEK
ncbi:uncharacterized protein KY384_005600 [Bacidia gigantensis]|uniref:uncharacterized protein n=1 Tax=Bacidia gigantensis TaxID=2732470 RepID=UPI001D046588|nr:uncharacterized protein KY384_005600 [Bacidia gigantensis]KAG8530118.1 hypothetical protein KY384_005600 [Bacidia gigantensis]